MGHSVLKQTLTRYLSEITPTKKGATQETDRIKAWMERPLGRRYLATIRSADMATYRDERLEQGCNPSTVRNELNIISHLFNVAKKEWGMESLINPIQNIRMSKMLPGRDRRLEEGEEEALLEAADYPLKQMIIIALETGMRLGEILNLRHDDLNLNKGYLVLLDTK